MAQHGFTPTFPCPPNCGGGPGGQRFVYHLPIRGPSVRRTAATALGM
jgi:hypothetical protein